MSRSCGTNCGLCCTTFSIPELGKLAGVRCEHLTDTNECGIYDERPDACRSFRCGYLEGIGPTIHPGRLGVFIWKWVEDFWGQLYAVDLVTIKLQDGKLPPKNKNKLFRRFMQTLNVPIAALRSWHEERPEDMGIENSETYYRLEDDPGYGYTRYFGRNWGNGGKWFDADDAVAAHPQQFQEDTKEYQRNGKIGRAVTTA